MKFNLVNDNKLQIIVSREEYGTTGYPQMGFGALIIRKHRSCFRKFWKKPMKLADSMWEKMLSL